MPNRWDAPSTISSRLTKSPRSSPTGHRRRGTTTRYLNTIKEAWGPLLVSGVKPKNVLKLRDAWAATPVAANHLLSVAKTLINWGIPREFSDSNPCLATAKLETDEGGARPWPGACPRGPPPRRLAGPLHRAAAGRRHPDEHGRLRGRRHQGHRRPEETCEGGDPAARTNRPGTLIGKLVESWKTHLIDLYDEMVGDRLTVGQRTLTPPVLVRIQVPQPFIFRHFNVLRPPDKSAAGEQTANAAAQKSAQQ